jgi:hypothetical protein
MPINKKLDTAAKFGKNKPMSEKEVKAAGKNEKKQAQRSG